MSTSTTTMLDIGRKAGHAEAVSMMRAVVRETQRIGPGFDLQAECIVRIVEHALASDKNVAWYIAQGVAWVAELTAKLAEFNLKLGGS